MKSVEELKVYNLAMELGEKVWDIVDKWNFFVKDTLGKQLVKAADSIASNLSEGFGRYHYLENKNFSYYSRGSFKCYCEKGEARRSNLVLRLLHSLRSFAMTLRGNT